ncbi:unnamed protein product [Owenia fusiformis]|uniref:DNA helicase n=1 Tax=Owenia fusiformis TaxID=6347 RepID=A0A8J1TGU4_OWEFU|nr:unnamed protein product [Owenia fusiformis]
MESPMDTPSTGDSSGEAPPAKSSKLDSLVKRLATERSDSPVPSPKSADATASRSGASRRKAKVTHKHIEDEDALPDSEPFAPPEDGAAEITSPVQSRENSTPASPEPGPSTREDNIDVDESGNLILPEGTVVVQPEAVDDKDAFKGPEFRGSGRKKQEVSTLPICGGFAVTQSIFCTACNKQINPNGAGNIKRHPVLKVLVCKRCYNWYTSAEIDQDSDGMDEQCRWCGEGGNLLCCDTCSNAFCKGCIKRNLGRAELSALMDLDDKEKWKCYVCNPIPLAGLIKKCDEILKEFTKYHMEQERKRAASAQVHEVKKKPLPGKPSPVPNRPPGRVQTGNLKVVSGPRQVIMANQATRGGMQPQRGGIRPGMPQRGGIQQRNFSPRQQQQQQRPTGQVRPGQVRPGQNIPPGQIRRVNNMPATSMVTPFRINESNLGISLEKFLAATQSMMMLLQSLKNDYNGTKIAKSEVVNRLRRALASYKENIRLIETCQVKPAMRNKQGQPVGVNKQTFTVGNKQFQSIPGTRQVVTTGAGRGGRTGRPTVRSNVQKVAPAKPIRPAGEVISESHRLDGSYLIVSNGKGGTVEVKVDENTLQNLAAITSAAAKDQQREATKPKPASDPDEIIILESDEEDEPKKAKASPSEVGDGDAKMTNGTKGGEDDTKKNSEDDVVTNDDDDDGDDNEKNKKDGNKWKMKLNFGTKRKRESGSSSESDTKDNTKEDSDEEEAESMRKVRPGPKSFKLRNKNSPMKKATSAKQAVLNKEHENTETVKEEPKDEAKDEEMKEEKDISDVKEEDDAVNDTTENEEVKDITEDTHEEVKQEGDTMEDDPSEVLEESEEHKENGHNVEENADDVDMIDDSEDTHETIKEKVKEKMEDELGQADYVDGTNDHMTLLWTPDDISSDHKGINSGQGPSSDYLDGVNDNVTIIANPIDTQKELFTSSEDESESSGSINKVITGITVNYDNSQQSSSDPESDKESIKENGISTEDSSKEDEENTKTNHDSERENIDNGNENNDSGKEKNNDNESKISDSENTTPGAEQTCESESKTEKEQSDMKESTEPKVTKELDNNDDSDTMDQDIKSVKDDIKDDDDNEKSEKPQKVWKEVNIQDDSSSSDDDDDVTPTPVKAFFKQFKSTPEEEETVDAGKVEVQDDPDNYRIEMDDSDANDDTEMMDTSVVNLESDQLNEDESLNVDNPDNYRVDIDLEEEIEPKKTPPKKKCGPKSKRKKVDSESDDENDDRTLEDVEAQKELLKEMLDSESESDSEFEFSDSSEDGVDKSSGDEFKPQNSSTSKNSKKLKGKDRSKLKDGKKSLRKRHKSSDKNDSSRDKISEKRRRRSSNSEKHNSGKDKSIKKPIRPLSKQKDKLKLPAKVVLVPITDSDISDWSRGVSPNRSKPKPKSHQKLKKPRRESSSSNHDSDLEDEIERLSKMPAKKGKSRQKKSDGMEKSKKESSKKEKVKRLPGKKKKKKEESSDSSSSSTSEEDEVSLSDSEDRSDVDMKKLKSKVPSDDENARAKRAMLAEMNDSDTEEDSDTVDEDATSDSDIKKVKKKSATKDSSNTMSDSDDSIGKPKKKAPYQDPLLRQGLSSSDSDSDFMATPVKKNRKRTKRSSSSDSDELNETESESDSDFKTKKPSRKKKRTSTSDSDSEEDTKKKKKGKGKGKGKKKKRRRIKRMKNSSDSDSSSSDRDKGSSDESGSGSDIPGSAKKRKKIRKLLKNKSLKDETKNALKEEQDRRERIKLKQSRYNRVTQIEDSSSPTKCPITTELILEKDEEDDKVLVKVDKTLVRCLKPHQVEAVQFIYDCTVENVKRLKKEEGSGCILAHCMGLGKTLSTVTFVHTMLTTKIAKQRTCLVVCPLNTVLNWVNEFEIWITEKLDEKKHLDIYELSTIKNATERADYLEQWMEGGGVMVIGYEMFRNLASGKNIKKKKVKESFAKSLLNPGPDIVVCDEGHILKNADTAVSKVMNQMKTRRRVILTGTPLQNNLIEYHCMVDFVKPNLLGTKKEFSNRFVNPIANGQCADSSSYDVKLMKKRAHILHEMLDGCVQRKDYSALVKYLPPKLEYVVSIRLSPVQIKMYRQYLDMNVDPTQDKVKGARLFADYQQLMRIWTHPYVLKLHEVREENKRQFDDEDSFLGSENDYDSNSSFIDNDSEISLVSDKSDDDILCLSSDDDGPKKGRKTRAQRKEANEKKARNDKDEVVNKWKSSTRGGEGSGRNSVVPEDEDSNLPISREWWGSHVSEEDRYKVELSGKIHLLFEVLKASEEIGDKVLVFSQSLLSLDIIEDFLAHAEEAMASQNKEEDNLKKMAGLGQWSKGVDYFRMDGSSNAQQRKRSAEEFNDPENYRSRLFLISTKAGSLGTNLIGANRVILFDASWNPSHDIQSIFRVFRFGQEKPVYIYRFLAQGTMEEKIYERQVTKQSLAQRVVDEHQIDRHFTARDLKELYNFTPDILEEGKEKPIPILPKDMLLADLLKSQEDWIVKYHEHDSLLENKIDEGLTEEERKAAWDEFENEKKRGVMTHSRPNGMAQPGLGLNPAYNHLVNNSAMNYNPMYQQAPGGIGGGVSYPNLMGIAKMILQRNPGISQPDLQDRIQQVVRTQLANQQHQAQLFLQQQQRRQMEENMRMDRLRMEAQYRARTGAAPESASSALQNLLTNQRK